MDFAGIGSLPLEWIAFGAVAALFSFDTFRSGPGRATAAALSAIVATSLYTAFGNAIFLAPLSVLADPMPALVIAALFAASYFLLHGAVDTYGGGAIIQAVLAGVAISVILCSLWVMTPALTNVWGAGTFQTIFGETYRFWWLIVGFALLSFARH